jgi:CHASE2 domain-containing sensor protein
MSATKPASNSLSHKLYLILAFFVLLYPLQAFAGDSSVMIVGIQNSSIDPQNVQTLLNQVQSENPEDTAARKALGLMQKPWPYPRSLYGLLGERLLELGAKTVAINILFPTSREDDESLAEVLKKYPGRIILAAAKGKSPQGGSFAVMPNGQLESAVGTNRIGYSYLEAEEDGIAHKFHTLYARKKELKDAVLSETDSLDWISFAALAVQTFNGKHISPRVHALDFRNVSKEAPKQAALPIEAVFADRLLKESPPYNNGHTFRDKLVFIGLAADSFHDTRPTEIGTLNSIEIHAQIARTLLNTKP